MKMNAQPQQLTEVAALALRVGQERQRKLREMKDAFKSGDVAQAIALARSLCGADEKDAAA